MTDGLEGNYIMNNLRKEVRRRFGGTTTDWTNIRKGDYVEAIRDKRDGNDIESKMKAH